MFVETVSEIINFPFKEQLYVEIKVSTNIVTNSDLIICLFSFLINKYIKYPNKFTTPIGRIKKLIIKINNAILFFLFFKENNPTAVKKIQGISLIMNEDNSQLFGSKKK